MDLRPTESGFVAVGGDLFVTGLMTAWTSPDGITWTRSPHPDEQTDPSVACMTAEAVTEAAGSLWAAGTDFDARRPEDQGVPALWSSVDGTMGNGKPSRTSWPAPCPSPSSKPPNARGVWPPPNSTPS